MMMKIFFLGGRPLDYIRVIRLGFVKHHSGAFDKLIGLFEKICLFIIINAITQIDIKLCYFSLKYHILYDGTTSDADVL